MINQPKLLIVGLKFTKAEIADIDKIIQATLKHLQISVDCTIIDLMNVKFPDPPPKYVLIVGDKTAAYVEPKLAKDGVHLTIPRVKEFINSQEKKANVWEALRGFFVGLQKGLLDQIQLQTLDKRKLVLDADIIAEKLTKEDYIASFKKLIEDQGTMIVETKDGQKIYVYPEEKDLPGKEQFEFTANEFCLLMGALLLFDASSARLSQEAL